MSSTSSRRHRERIYKAFSEKKRSSQKKHSNCGRRSNNGITLTEKKGSDHHGKDKKCHCENVEITARVFSQQTSLIYSVIVNTPKPAKVQILYSNKQAGKFITVESPTFQNSTTTEVMRLRAGTKYRYRAIITYQDGEVYVTPKKSFITGSLPDTMDGMNFQVVGKLSPELILLVSLSQQAADGISSQPTSQPIVVKIEPNVRGGHVIVDQDGFVVWYYLNIGAEGISLGDAKQLPGPSYGFLTFQGDCENNGDIPHFIQAIRPNTTVWVNGRQNLATVDVTRLGNGPIPISSGVPTSGSTGLCLVDFSIPTPTSSLIDGLFVVLGNNNTSYNGSFNSAGITVKGNDTSIRLVYPSNPGNFDSSSVTTIAPVLGILGPHHEVLLPCGSTGVNATNNIYYLGSSTTNPLNDINQLQMVDTVRYWENSTGSDYEVWRADKYWDPVTQRNPLTSDTTFTMQCNPDQCPISPQEWIHINALSVSPYSGNFVISLRLLNSIAFFDPTLTTLQFVVGTGEFIPSNYSFPNVNDQFYGQHRPHQISNGNLLIFDNGLHRPTSAGGQYSRALEIKLDPVTLIAEKIWEYVVTPNIFCPVFGSVIRLENGNTLVDFGGIQSSTPAPVYVVEAGKESNTKVGELIITHPNLGMLLYRALPLETINGEIKISD